VPSVDQVAAEQEVAEAESLLASGDVDTALAKLGEAVAINPGNDAARYEYLHALLTAGRVADARRAYEPVASKVLQDVRIAACGHWLSACEQAAAGRTVEQLEGALQADKRDFDARFELAQHRFAALRFTQAMDELLEILMRDKAWQDGLARKTFVAVLEVMGRQTARTAERSHPKSTLELAGNQPRVASDTVVDSYRRRLSMVVF
jgi:putative thioredoxin